MNRPLLSKVIDDPIPVEYNLQFSVRSDLAQSRRKFLNLLLNFGAGLVSFGPLTILNNCGPKPQITTDRTFHRTFADLHAHVMINQWNRTTPLAKRYPLIEARARAAFNRFRINLKHCYEAGVDMICAAHFNVFDEWLSMPTDPNPEASIHTIQMLDQLERELNGPLAAYARLAENGNDLAAQVSTPKADPDWRTAIVHTLEGGH